MKVRCIEPHANRRIKYGEVHEAIDNDAYYNVNGVNYFKYRFEVVEEQSEPANPKQAYGDKKPRLTLTPLSAQLAQFEAQMDGALKYGEVNWRENPVEAKTYIDAALRHLRLYENGEEFARDTTVQNLGAVMACCAILIDAAAHGTLIDNRSHSPVTCDLLHDRGEHMVKHLKEMQAQREAARG